MEIEKVGNVPARDGEQVTFSDWECILDQERERVLRNDRPLSDITEWATRFSGRIAVLDPAKVGVVTRALVSVAQPAQSLKVLGIVRAADSLGDDVVHVERTFIRRNAAQLAAECGTF